MNLNKILFAFITPFLFLLITSTSCSETDALVDPDIEVVEEEYDDTVFETTDWTDATHSKSGDPAYDMVFNDNEVQRIDIVITEERWNNMLADMTSKYGSFGRTNSGGPGGGGAVSDTENPIFVPGEVFYNGKEWYRVGVRFKGNSSLQSTWQSGNLKLSFKLDFDEFEDEYPQIDNQRFNGFKKLSLKNNYNDSSFMREKVAGDVFRSAGLAGAHTAFYAVYVDNGDGPTYFGLYTMVEEISDTVIDDQFSSDKGNLYEPDGDGASFASGTYDTDEIAKENNEDEADFSDVRALYDILHDGSRTTNPASWRIQLESVFDTDAFLKYLAVNTTIQNWDTYGRMTHNYYLYNNPDNGLLTWIPWDNNEALQNGNQQGSLNLNFSDLSTNQWPIIGYMYQQDEYKAKYDAYLQEVIDGAFEPTAIQSLYTQYQTLLEPYATTEVQGYTFLRNSSEFSSAVSTLKSHVQSRKSAVESYLK
ncbi:CotH kinase family protein [Arcticibacterium luteifluviistationis]|uniref:Spore coat protein n=1 Tax=Arcticibacterium luteifluviistationis TaxID=1784714 RepID=A0A2Z4GGF1_9BACT|nr:CotH kinase family protein [Arcticibacterium luteifluviistationis]AWW00262.1 spore coat protein [Arcticibacterium luteifluviistationis]